MDMRFLKRFFLLPLLLLLSQFSVAAIIQYGYSATITSHGGLSSDLHSILPIGAAVSGTFKFDSNTTAVYDGDAVEYNEAVLEFTVEFGGFYLSIDNGVVNVTNDLLMPPPAHDPEAEVYLDAFQVAGNGELPSLPTLVDTNINLSNYVSETINSGYHFRTMEVLTNDATGQMLDGGTLNNLPISLFGDGGLFSLTFELDCCTGRTSVNASLTNLTLQSVTAVPLPPSMGLYLLSFVSFAWAKRFRRTHR